MGSEEKIQSVGSKLLDEIVRVAAKIERWRGYRAQIPGNAGLGMDLTIALMEAELRDAKTAVASNDAAHCIRALQTLEGYDND